MGAKSLLVGIAFLIGAVILYKIRSWDKYEGELADGINSMRSFRTWMLIVMCLIAGIVFLAKA